MIPSCSQSSMQMPTPPMTMADYQMERHHRCSERQCLLSDEVLQHKSNDWTLFPSEEAPLAEPTPRPVIMNQNARISKPAQGLAQMDSKARKQQRQTSVKRERKTQPHPSRLTKAPSTGSATEQDVTSLTGGSMTVECSDGPDCRVAGFEDLPRTSASAPTFGRRPTPPLEGMGEMFASIESLGEDLRWYRSVQGSHNGHDRSL